MRSNKVKTANASSRFVTPLRYPGGKGKVAPFIDAVLHANDLVGSKYVEAFAGGAGVAMYLLLRGSVDSIVINDISRPVYSFWKSVLDATEDLCRAIYDTPVTVAEWERQHAVFRNQDKIDDFTLSLAFFFLNRTNRSGILEGGMIGGRSQSGTWKIDARYNKSELIGRITEIADRRTKIQVTQLDARDLIVQGSISGNGKAFMYLDPPYYVKGRSLYPDSFLPDDHEELASTVRGKMNFPWIVSYDIVEQIDELYAGAPWVKYCLSYSAKVHSVGSEVMYFSDGLVIPSLKGSMKETARST